MTLRPRSSALTDDPELRIRSARRSLAMIEAKYIDTMLGSRLARFVNTV
jgi:hypothetical protein